jgi:diphosphomevalonate decarboxylase
VQVAPPEHWDLRLVVAVTAEGEKDVGSTEGMIRTAETSPLYDGWIRSAPAIFERVKAALLARDFDALGRGIEQSSLTMHATAFAADPGLLYWRGASVEVMRAVGAMRAQGAAAYFTMDAGPHVKVVTLASEVARVEALVAQTPGVLRTIVAEPGPGAHELVGESAGVNG